MNYELAKQLKDAGFPQIIPAGGQYYKFISHPRMGVPPQQALNTTFITDMERIVDDYVKCPTLSELIEACGEAFASLEYSSGVNSNRNKGSLTWEAKAYKKGFIIARDGDPSNTPEEAVAKIWLDLHKK